MTLSSLKYGYRIRNKKVHKDRVDIASSINLDLWRLQDWGSLNLVNFNAVKTQCCLISRRVDRNIPDIFDSNSLEFSDKISMLGVTLGSDLSLE